MIPFRNTSPFNDFRNFLDRIKFIFELNFSVQPFLSARSTSGWNDDNREKGSGRPNYLSDEVSDDIALISNHPFAKLNSMSFHKQAGQGCHIMCGALYYLGVVTYWHSECYRMDMTQPIREE